MKNITRKSALKAMVGIAAISATPAIAEIAPTIELPVAPHAGECPGGNMCWLCQDVLEDYEAAIDPITKRAIVAFWQSIHKDLPFLKRVNREWFVANMEDSAREYVTDYSFGQWQKTATAKRIRATLPPLEDEEDQ